MPSRREKGVAQRTKAERKPLGLERHARRQYHPAVVSDLHVPLYINARKTPVGFIRQIPPPHPDYGCELHLNNILVGWEGVRAVSQNKCSLDIVIAIPTVTLYKTQTAIQKCAGRNERGAAQPQT
ncbi:unnamed protein product [Ectocarpus sp. 6 AP-2014]